MVRDVIFWNALNFREASFMNNRGFTFGLVTAR